MYSRSARKKAYLFHDALDVLAANANDALMIRFWNVEGKLSRQLFLQKSKPVQCTGVIARELNAEATQKKDIELHLRHF